MTAIEAASTEEIDALLAQADLLMADMADSLGEQRPQQSASPPADRPAVVPEGAGQAGVAEAVTEEPQISGAPSAEPPESSGEPSANPPEPSGEASPDQAETPAETASEPEAAEPAGGDGAKPATQPEASAAEGPQSPPPDWLLEADINSLAENVNESLPQIPETLTSEEAPACEHSAPRPAIAARVLPRVAAVVVHVPIDLLILLDWPFSRLNAGAKSCLGYAAIGTLIVSLATWLLGNAQGAN